MKSHSPSSVLSVRFDLDFFVAAVDVITEELLDDDREWLRTGSVGCGSDDDGVCVFGSVSCGTCSVGLLSTVFVGVGVANGAGAECFVVVVLPCLSIFDNGFLFGDGGFEGRCC